MSIGHGDGYGGIKTPAELKKMMAAGDTQKLAERKVKLDVSHDIPLAFGISVDGHTVYGDRRYIGELRNGSIKVSGMKPDDIIAAHVVHEITEKAIADGDNPIFLYEGAHPFGQTAEHEFVKRIRGTDRGYEEALKLAIDRCFTRNMENPPKNYWCGPLLDEEIPKNRVILRKLAKKGVIDAKKGSKRDAGYGFGAERCRDCRYFAGGTLNTCAKVSGLVRADRQCDWFEPKRKRANP